MKLFIELIAIFLIAIFIVLLILVLFNILTNVYLKCKKEVYITHRGTKASIEEKISSGKLTPNVTFCRNPKRLKYEHNKECIWVSLGKPNLYTYLGSGMIGRKAYSYVSFKVYTKKIKSPSGLKKAFPISQRVIEEEILIPHNAIIRLK